MAILPPRSARRLIGCKLRRPLACRAACSVCCIASTSLEHDGGSFGLGFIRAEAEIHPDDWFLVCHFVDDRVMPGTLMYESCLQALRILLDGDRLDRRVATASLSSRSPECRSGSSAGARSSNRRRRSVTRSPSRNGAIVPNLTPSPMPW